MKTAEDIVREINNLLGKLDRAIVHVNQMGYIMLDQNIVWIDDSTCYWKGNRNYPVMYRPHGEIMYEVVE